MTGYRLAMDVVKSGEPGDACEVRELGEIYGEHVFEASHLFNALASVNDITIDNIGPATPPFKHMWIEARAPDLERPYTNLLRFWFGFAIDRFREDFVVLKQYCIYVYDSKERYVKNGVTKKRVTCVVRRTISTTVDLDASDGRVTSLSHCLYDLTLKRPEHKNVLRAYKQMSLACLIALSMAHRKSVSAPIPPVRIKPGRTPTEAQRVKMRTRTTYSRILLPARKSISGGERSTSTDSNAENRKAWFVRGHWRQYKDHRTFVDEHICGNPDLGWVKQEYLLKSLKDAHRAKEYTSC